MSHLRGQTNAKQHLKNLKRCIVSVPMLEIYDGSAET